MASLYLDLVRFLAAVAVFCDHWAMEIFTGGAIWPRIGHYGDLSVTIFFVLSGYVIAFVTEKRETSGRAYVAARLSRLYSVTAVALVLTFLLDAAGAARDPSLYAQLLPAPPALVDYVASFFLVNEFQIFAFGGLAPGSNAPFWSLSFEAAYYAIAGLLLYAPRRFGLPLALLLLCAAGRTIAAMFPLWLMGVALYRFRARLAPPRRVALPLALASAAALLALPSVVPYLPDQTLAFPWARGQFNRLLAYDYLVALCFCAHLAAAAALAERAPRLPDAPASIVRRLATLTFPLYAMHFPALAFFRALSPWPADSFANAGFLALMSFGLVALLTPLCERLKLALRRLLGEGEGLRSTAARDAISS